MQPVYLLIELAAGLFLLGGAALAGFLLVHRPWPNRLDVVGFDLLPANPTSRLFNDIALAGSLQVLVGGVLVAALVAVWRDRARALACLIAPVLAVLVTEWVAKPLVGRHVTVVGGNSYPSGTVTAATALVVALLLAAPRTPRALLTLPGLGVIASVCAAVVAMRWHYPTDALGGICVGAGTVLLLDGLFHVPAALRARFAGRDGELHALDPERDRELDTAAYGRIAAQG
jgi:membrane-associated phospholipid phosphatase